MIDYYKKRAQEYEEIYNRQDPERIAEQENISESIRQFLMNRNIIEIACGTGYWTKFLSESAKSIVATDAVKEVMDIAMQKDYSCKIQFQTADAYNLQFENEAFDGCLAMFWFSHINKARINEFLEGLHRILKSGSRVFIGDNLYVEGIGGKLVVKKGEQDTYKERTLKDGTQELVLKNYYSKEELKEIFEKHVHGFSTMNIHFGKCFWHVEYELMKQ